MSFSKNDLELIKSKIILSQEIEKKTKVIKVGNVKVGGNNPITVQSMTNTLTKNVKETLSQINKISEVGGDIVRVSCPDEDSTKALKEIVHACTFGSINVEALPTFDLEYIFGDQFFSRAYNLNFGFCPFL